MLYERYANQIFGYRLHQLGSREEAEAAVQSTFLNAFRGLKRGVVPEMESAWLFKIAHNVCLSRRRSSWRRGRIESPADFDVLAEELAAAPARRSDELMGLQDVLETMPENQRRAILLREWQGLSYREIADELELSQAAVETLIFRARRSLASSAPAAAGVRAEARAPPRGRPRKRARRNQVHAAGQRGRREGRGDRRRHQRDHGRGCRAGAAPAASCDAVSSAVVVSPGSTGAGASTIVQSPSAVFQGRAGRGIANAAAPRRKRSSCVLSRRSPFGAAGRRRRHGARGSLPSSRARPRLTQSPGDAPGGASSSPRVPAPRAPRRRPQRRVRRRVPPATRPAR